MHMVDQIIHFREHLPAEILPKTACCSPRIEHMNQNMPILFQYEETFANYTNFLKL